MTKYEILPERCVQTGNCLELAPGLFDRDDDGVTVTTKDSAQSADEREALKAAAGSCPALAIVLEE